MERVETQLEKCVSQLTTAILESSLRELGTVGALRVDEFWNKTFKTALQGILVKQRADVAARGAMPSIDLHPWRWAVPELFLVPAVLELDLMCQLCLEVLDL